MPKPRRKRVAPLPPDPAAGEQPLPSDSIAAKVSVKLDGAHRLMLLDLRSRLTDTRTGYYPTASAVVRRALSTLYHTLTGHPPTGAYDGRTATD